MRRWGAVVTMAIAASAACGRTASDVTGGRGGAAPHDAAGGAAPSTGAGGTPMSDGGGASGTPGAAGVGGAGGGTGGSGGVPGAAGFDGGRPVCPAPGEPLPACDWQFQPPADGLVCRRLPTAEGCPVEVTCMGVVPGYQDSVYYWLWVPTTGWEGEPCALPGQRCTTDRENPGGNFGNGRQVFVHVCGEAGVWQRELGDATP